MFKEFKEFAMRGNVIDMAVGIIIGAAFTAVVTSLVADVITPPLTLIQESSVAFEDLAIPLGQPDKDGVFKEKIAIGKFLNSIVQFLLTAFAVFLLVRTVNKLRKKPEPEPETTKECPYCMNSIPKAATRCGCCTSQLTA